MNLLAIPKMFLRRSFVGSPADSGNTLPIRLAVMGDSLSTGFHVSSVLPMIIRARLCGRNWVVDDSGQINSVFERLATKIPVELEYLAYVSAHVNSECGRSLLDRVVGTMHMSDQVDRLLNLRRFPHVILIWMGHNNLDWVQSCSSGEIDPSALQNLAEEAVRAYEAQLLRLWSVAANQSHKVTFVVFALVSFEFFFAAREAIEAIKIRDPSRYPFLENDYQYFQSMRKPYRSGMIQLANMINSRLQAMVHRTEGWKGSRGMVSARFSTALHDAPINRPEMLCEVDAWHPSRRGHQILAEHAFPVVWQHVQEHHALEQP